MKHTMKKIILLFIIITTFISCKPINTVAVYDYERRYNEIELIAESNFSVLNTFDRNSFRFYISKGEKFKLVTFMTGKEPNNINKFETEGYRMTDYIYDDMVLSFVNNGYNNIYLLKYITKF